MHITIRQYKTDAPKEVTKIVNEGFFPLITKVAGFVAYYGVETGEDGWASISVFETPAGLRNPTVLQQNLSRITRTCSV